MTNRAVRTHPDFVRALNSIDIAFNAGDPSKITPKESAVVKAWHEYFDETNKRAETEEEATKKLETLNNLAVDIYEAIAADLGLSFERKWLRSPSYYTQLAADQDFELTRIRRALARLLAGEDALSIVNMQRDAEGRLHPLKFPGGA